MTPTMRAIEILRPGAPEVLALCQRPVPEPGVGECLIEVAASGLNRPDLLQRRGLYPPPPGASHLPGLEVAGTVVRGDAQALAEAGLQVGQRVCALVAGGGYAEYCVAPVAQCLPVPAGLSDVEAAAIPETFFTVWQNVFEIARLQSGETLLIHGGTSGIGVTAIQLARAFGAQVWVTCGSDEKCTQARQVGAHGAINYRTQDFVHEVLAATGQRGADVILDMVAGDYLRRDVQCAAEDGRIAVIAVQGGTDSQLDAGVLLRRRLTITGSTLRARPLAYKAGLARSLRERVWPLLEAGTVRPLIHAVHSAESAAAAHEQLEEGRHVGKIVLVWNG